MTTRRSSRRGRRALLATVALVTMLAPLAVAVPAGAAEYTVTARIRVEAPAGRKAVYLPGKAADQVCTTIPRESSAMVPSSGTVTLEVKIQVSNTGGCLSTPAKAEFQVRVAEMRDGQEYYSSFADFELRQEMPHYFNMQCTWRTVTYCDGDSGIFEFWAVVRQRS